MGDKYLDGILNRGKHVDNPHLLDRNPEMEFQFDKESVINLLSAVAKSAPTVTDREHPPHWWNQHFGKRIRADWRDKINAVISQVERMVEPW